jgi:hypothetical protein
MNISINLGEDAKKESVPSSSDIYDLHVYYQKANQDDRDVIDSPGTRILSFNLFRNNCSLHSINVHTFKLL